jgi:hypothetical protein
MVDSVTDLADGGPNASMSAIGYGIAALNLVVLLPLVPFLVLFWLYDAVTGDRIGEYSAEPDSDKPTVEGREHGPEELNRD